MKQSDLRTPRTSVVGVCQRMRLIMSLNNISGRIMWIFIGWL